MTDAVFHVETLSEGFDFEVKAAQGRDGRGALPNDIWETYSAFANTDGGRIVLGVAERKRGQFEFLGIADPAGVEQALWTQVNNPQKVSRNVLTAKAVARVRTKDGTLLIAIDVPRASRKERPIYINGNPMTGTYKRLNEGDFRCTPEEVRRMLAEQTEDERDARILSGYCFDDIHMGSFRAYRNRFAAQNPDHPYNNDDEHTFIRKVGGWRRDRTTGEEGLTLAGLLMFGQFESIREAAPNYFLDYRELPVGGSKTEWVDRLTPDGTWSGNLYDFYRAVIQRLFRELKVPFRLQGGEREDDTPVHKALREALVNAIVHADYAASTSILAVKAPDYFGFRNPGRMRIPIEKALEGGTSDCRNRRLQLMFRLIGLGEQAGSGIPRVLEHWKSQHYRLPELWESQEPEATLMRLRTVSLLPNETLSELRTRLGPDFDALDENARLTLATARIEGFVTNGRMQQISRQHARDITTMLRKLVEDGFLQPDGHGRATTYRIAGTEAVDLANSAEFDSGSFDHLSGSSDHLGLSSDHLSASSEHMGEEIDDPTHDPVLLRIAEPVRSKGKADADLIRSSILALCTDRFLTLPQIARLLERSPNGLRQRFVKPMIADGVLKRRFPHQPNHEKQAYRTSKADDE